MVAVTAAGLILRLRGRNHCGRHLNTHVATNDFMQTNVKYILVGFVVRNLEYMHQASFCKVTKINRQHSAK